MIFRSEDMSYYELKMTPESAWYFMEEIGLSGLIHFIPASKD